MGHFVDCYLRIREELPSSRALSISGGLRLKFVSSYRCGAGSFPLTCITLFYYWKNKVIQKGLLNSCNCALSLGRQMLHGRKKKEGFPERKEPERKEPF